MTCSHSNVPKSAIRKAYANFIAWKEQYVIEQQEPYIQKAMQQTFWQKLLGKPARTREEAIAWCNENYIREGFSEYHWCKVEGWGTEATLSKLVDLCNLSTDEGIMISSEDAAVVLRFY
jgi:hypothetical protein